ncbi:MAG TPA: sulfur transferase domain-containing protein [Luteimonas sp.]|nr:sulfur transferase domain-containing protein [Luteimonas sp.]
MLPSIPSRAGLLACLFAAALASSCTTTRAPVADTPAATPAVGSIQGLRAPRAGLLTSAQPDADAWRALADDGVVAVVNLRPDAEQPGRDEGAEVAAAGMAYHQIPVAGADDLSDANAAELWRILQDNEGRVLVHCASGNRAGALLAIGAERSGTMSALDALAFGRAAGLTSPALEAKVRERLGLPVEPVSE